MDRRSKRTKNLIYSAFTELLLKEKYSKITIQQIIDLADIGRSTFYSHFETKDELLKTMCTDLFDEIYSNHLAFSSAKPYSMLLNILCHIKENQKVIKGVLLSESGELFINYFKSYFSSHIEQNILVSDDKHLLNIPKDFLINHICGSFWEMIKWWICDNKKYTPEELTDYYISVIYPIVRMNTNK